MGAQKRLDNTFSYLNKMIEILPATRQAMQTKFGRDHIASNKIALGLLGTSGHKREPGWEDAMHALLLCVYWCNPNLVESARTHYKNSGEAILQDAICSFFPLKEAGVKNVVDRATKVDLGVGTNLPVDFYRYRRASVNGGLLKMAGNCYGSMALWLYLAGLVSLRWLVTHGGQPGFELPIPWTWGEKTASLEVASEIPEGNLIRFDRSTGSGLHYAISTSKGVCRGVNQSSDACKDWPNVAFGPAPTTAASEFQIAGYMAAINMTDPKGSTVRWAPCMPKVGYQF